MRLGSGTLKLFFAFVLFFCVFSRVFSQNTVSLSTEISRLEKVSFASGGTSNERHNAFLNLARLYQLSGSHEAAVKVYADALAIFPADCRFLLEQAQLFISLGEYEKAVLAINTVLKSSQDQEFLLKGQYLGALALTFLSSAPETLIALADDPDFMDYRSGIYYALWKFSGLQSYRNRLTTEFPQSPEAKIAGGGMEAVSTPLWLLFPGRNSIILSNPLPSQPAVAAVPPAPSPASGESGVLLQTALFSLAREDYARALAERLKKAGFVPEIFRRKVNGNDYFAVGVRATGDMNAMIKKLKDAGFESFPITN